MQGIWPPCADGTDVNAVERSPSGKVLATVDDFGKVKVFKYPCAIEKAGSNAFKGHSSHVTNCTFTKSSRYLLSTGGNDKALFQWKYAEDGVEE